MSTSRVSGLTCATRTMLPRGESRQERFRAPSPAGRAGHLTCSRFQGIAGRLVVRLWSRPGGRSLMRPATLVSFLWDVLARGLLLLGWGGAAQPVVQVGPMAEGGSFTGVWFSPQYGEMPLEQNGSSAIGRYSKDERSGRLQGS